MDAHREQKQEIKFRVTSKTAGQKPWSEKWAVKMGEGEEFIVTDEILKFPSHELSGKVVCTFSMIQEKLQFEYRDKDRICSVGGETYAGGSEHRPVTEGETIDIGEGIRIEIVKAPLLPKFNAQESDGPSLVSLTTEPIEHPAPLEESLPGVAAPIEIKNPDDAEILSAARSDFNEQSSASIPMEAQIPHTGSELPATEAVAREDSNQEDAEPSALSDEVDHAGETQAAFVASDVERNTTNETKKKFNLEHFLAPINHFAHSIFLDRNARMAVVGVCALLGGVLVWKVVNGNNKSPVADRSIAQDSGSMGEGQSFSGGPRMQIEPLSPGVPITEIQSRIPQFEALAIRMKTPVVRTSSRNEVSIKSSRRPETRSSRRGDSKSRR